MPRNVGISKGYARAKNRDWQSLVGGRKTSFTLSRGSNVNQSAVTQRDVQKIINKLRRLPYAYQDSELKKILRRNSKVIVKRAKSNIPKAQKTVKRYLNGKVVATYTPGNLRRSIGVLPLRRTSAVFVGPRAGEKYKNDGWYGHFLELDTVKHRGIHYMERAYKATRNIVVRGIASDVKAVLKSYIRKNRIR